MATDEAFLADIIEHPDDDAPRLIYADWLDEQGRSERAEFIRVQCARAAHSEDAALLRREQELLDEHGDAWRPEAPAWLRDNCEFHRGFVTVVSGCSVGDWMRHGRDLVRQFPIEEVRFRADEPWEDPHANACAAALAASPSLARLRCLILAYVHLSSDGVRRLVTSPYLTRLTELSLAGNGLRTRLVEPLASSEYLPGLTDLDLRDNEIGDIGARILAATTRLTRLRSLQLVNTRLRDAGLAALASGPWPDLAHLYLGHNSITDTGVRALVQSPLLAGLRTLDLRSNRIFGEGAHALAAAPGAANLTLLDLVGNPIEPAVISALRRRFGSAVRF
jgi:uncharacterized protein (TIGR02996 family)